MTEVARAASKAREWTARRDRLITEAVAAGTGVREVARQAEMNHTSVLHIVRREAASAGLSGGLGGCVVVE